MTCALMCLGALALTACDDDGGTSCTDINCPEHQTCMMVDGRATCVCDDGYTGDDCDECETGYVMNADGDCIYTNLCGADSCSGHGDCDDSTGSVVCTCDDGYAGSFCDECATGYLQSGDDCILGDSCDDGDPCGEHGICNDSTGVVVCNCDDGYAGDVCDECAAGYHDDGLDHCVPDEECGTNTCNGHGTCDDSSGTVVCTCDEGYGGDHCDECADGYHLDGEACVSDELCPRDYCHGRGVCRVVGGIAQCECDEGFAGDRCDDCENPEHEVNIITGLCELPCPEGFGWIRCGDECVFGLSEENCGGCGVDCGDGYCEYWETGTPSCYCWADTCGDLCVDLQRNEENCGECGNACDDDEVCFLGTCQTSSPGCEEWCEEEWGICCPGGRCLWWEEAWMDPMNCGGCDIVCGDDEVCIMGVCQTESDACDPPCEEWGVCCDTAWGGQCFDSWSFGWDPDNCGGCGIECIAGESCEEGECVCREPSIRCGGSCTNPEYDNANCGECGNVCDLAAGERCTMGVCETSEGECSGCSATQICCENHSGASPEYECVDVRELDYNTEHCGGCDPCAAGESCLEGVCRCPGMYSDYCGDPPVCTDLWTHENCGECGNACQGDAYCDVREWPGTPSCICYYTECPGGMCADLMTSEENCGECGNVCDEEGSICAAGRCVTPNSDECERACPEGSVCCVEPDEGWSRCVDGWEMQWNANHCGGCSIQCDEGEVCFEGECQTAPGDSCDDPADAMLMREGNLCDYSDTMTFPVDDACDAVDGGPEAFYQFTVPIDLEVGIMFGAEEFEGTLHLQRWPGRCLHSHGDHCLRSIVDGDETAPSCRRDDLCRGAQQLRGVRLVLDGGLVLKAQPTSDRVAPHDPGR